MIFHMVKAITVSLIIINYVLLEGFWKKLEQNACWGNIKFAGTEGIRWGSRFLLELNQNKIDLFPLASQTLWLFENKTDLAFNASEFC